MDGKQSMKTPLYQAVVDKLMEQIRAGAFSFDEPLCTEARLMEKHGISRITARRALDELESKGLIRDADIFYVRLMLTDYRKLLEPGTYTLNTSMKSEEMMAVMAGETSDGEEES